MKEQSTKVLEKIAGQTEILKTQMETIAAQMESIKSFGESQSGFFMASHTVFQKESERMELNK